MTFTPEQTDEIKKQLLTQVEQLPQENKEQIKEYIKHLDSEQLEGFLRENKIQISESGKGILPQNEKPIFESIVKGEIPSYKIAENNKAVAILEINPLSKGHLIVLPKEKVPAEKIPKSAMTLAQKLAKKIKAKLKPEDIKIETSSFQDYPMINIIPLYKNQQLKKQKAEEKELKEIQKKLGTKKRSPREKKEKSLPERIKIPKIEFRIP